MTPGILQAKKHKISYLTHEYSHDETSESYGQIKWVLLKNESLKR